MKYTLLFLFVSVTQLAQAQTPSDKEMIKRAANDYLDGFYFGDTAKIYRSIDSTASKHGYYKANETDLYRKIPMSFKQMITYAKNDRNRVTESQGKIREVEILDMMDKIAAVKVRAWWGVDYLLLTRMDDRWVIEKVLWQSKK